MQHLRASDVWARALHGGRFDDDGIPFLDDALVELVEEPRPKRRAVLELVEAPARPRAPVDFEDAVTRVWIRPYAARLRLVGAR